jgi:hypothetical protein
MEMVLDVKKIRSRYLHGWFWLDFFASMPYDVIEYALIGNSDVSADELGALGLLKLPRLLRLGKLLKTLDQLSGATAIRILYVVITFMMIAHWLGCAWWQIGMLGDRLKDTTHANDPFFGIPWTRRIAPGTLGLNPQSTFAQAYLSSLYWALTTMMKTPMVGPDTIYEKIFACVAVGIGAIMFAVLLTFVSALTRQSQSYANEKRDALARVGGLTKAFGLTPAMHARLANHVEAYWNLVSGLSDNKILAQLPQQLRAEILLGIHTETMHFTSLLTRLSPECTVQILSKFQTEMGLDKEIVVAHKQNLGKVFMLLRGSLTVTLPLADDDKSSAAGGSARHSSAAARCSSTESGGALPKACGGGGGGGGGMPKMCGAGADEGGSRSSASLDRRSCSKSAKMGLRGNVAHVLEKPGSTVGGGKLFSSELDMYPFDVTVTRKVTMLSIQTRELEGILVLFGKGDSEQVTTFLRDAHKRLVDAIHHSARRSSCSVPAWVPGAAGDPAQTSCGASDAAGDAPGRCSLATVSEDGPAAAEASSGEGGDKGGQPASPNFSPTTAKAKENAERTKKMGQEASELEERVGKLEQSTTALATALERMSDDMRGIPRMLKILASAGAVGGAKNYQPGRQSFADASSP